MFFLVFILLLFILCFIFIETKIKIDFVLENSYNLVDIRIYLLALPFLRKKIKLSIMKDADGDITLYLLKRKTKKKLTCASKVLQRTGKFKGFLLKTNPWEFTSIKSLKLRVDMGLGDAAVTAVTAGLLQSAILASFNFLNFKDSEKMNAQVYFSPEFEKIIFKAKLQCILGIKMAHIINTLIKKFINKRRKK